MSLLDLPVLPPVPLTSDLAGGTAYPPLARTTCCPNARHWFTAYRMVAEQVDAVIALGQEQQIAEAALAVRLRQARAATRCSLALALVSLLTAVVALSSRRR